jgi:hypothetical protein
VGSAGVAEGCTGSGVASGVVAGAPQAASANNRIDKAILFMAPRRDFVSTVK